LNAEVEERRKEREEAGCKLTAGLYIKTRNSMRRTSESYINCEDVTTI
jgi:hypothetical protein